jgi:group II intron reverse transcriptase/maturase
MERESAQHEAGLWEQIFSRENLFAALERVRSNKGAPGVDGMTVEELADHLRAHWPSIRHKLDEGTYRPSPVRQVPIPKPGGGTRLLGIPTVLDRLIQQAMQQKLNPLFEPTFSDHSYGFRPGRSAHDAVCAAQEHIRAGYQWVVDIDLEKFFDTVNHDRLMARMKEMVSDKRVLRLVNLYLKAGVMVGGLETAREEGTPQGSPLSPLLSNIVLTELDHKLEERGHRFVRYVDDCNIYVRSERAGQRVMTSVQHFIEQQMRLKVNEAKSAVDRVDKRPFLGFSFYWREDEARIRLAPHSLDRIRHKLRMMTRRHRGEAVDVTIARLNPLIVGWVNYFAIADADAWMRALDSHLRRRLRQKVWKQWKTTHNRYRNLCCLGVSPIDAAGMARSSRGLWRLSATPTLHWALSKAYWLDRGLRSFHQQYLLRRT